jgi:hypothetical protein
MRIATILICVAAIGWLASCSDSNTNAPAPADYYKGLDKLGNYWIYQRNEIDTNGNIVTSVTSTDSTWVAGIELYQGKNASKIITMMNDAGDISYDTMYIARSGDSLFTYMQLPQLGILDTAAPKSQWALLSSITATTEWTIAPTQTTTQSIQIPVGGNNVPADLTISLGITGAHKSDTTIACANGQKYTTKYFQIKPNISGSIKALGGLLTQPISTIGLENSSFFADGIGLVAQIQPNSVFKVGDLFSQKSPGQIKTLLRYRIQ